MCAIVVVKWPGGRIDSFDFAPPPGSTWFPAIGAAEYLSRPGTFSTLTPLVWDETFTTYNDGNLYTDLSFTNFYDPQQFLLTDLDGTTYVLDVDKGLVEFTDFRGNTTRFTEDGIVPDIGSGVDFIRDASKRITSMILPDGSVLQYVYDGAGDLVQAIDGEGGVVDFGYDAEHRLVDYNIAGNPPIMQLTYDPSGRLIDSVGIGGVADVITRNGPQFVEIMRDAIKRHIAPVIDAGAT